MINFYSAAPPAHSNQIPSEIPPSATPLQHSLSQKCQGNLVESGGIMPSALSKSLFMSWASWFCSSFKQQGLNWASTQCSPHSAGVWQHHSLQNLAVWELLPVQLPLESQQFPLKADGLDKEVACTAPQLYLPVLTNPSHKSISVYLLEL